jgi:type II secretion system protein G
MRSFAHVNAMRALNLIIVLAVLAAASVATEAADTAPASQPAPAASEVRSAVRAYMLATVDADEKAIFDMLALKDEDAANEARAVIGEAVARLQFQDILDEAFKAADNSSAGTKEKKARKEDIAKQVDAADVSTSGYTATVKVAPKNTIILALDKGLWKVDFAATQRANFGPYDKDRINAAIAKTEIYRDVMGKVKEHQYKTRDDAEAEARVRVAKVPEPQTEEEINAKRRATVKTMADILGALHAFEDNNGRFPTTAEGLNALVTQPLGLEHWHKLLDRVPVDAWGEPFVYKLNDDHVTFELLSSGPDRKPSTADDITQYTKIR